jgi:hypothetical protein
LIDDSGTALPSVTCSHVYTSLLTCHWPSGSLSSYEPTSSLPLYMIAPLIRNCNHHTNNNDNDMIASLTFPFSLPNAPVSTNNKGEGANTVATHEMIHHQWLAIWSSLCDTCNSPLEWDIMIRLHRDDNGILLHRSFHITALSI